MLYGVSLNVAPDWLPAGDVANITLTVLWFVAVTNAVQFLDGMDGLAAGLGVIAGVFFSMTALQTDQRHLTLSGGCGGVLHRLHPGRAGGDGRMGAK